VKVAIDAMGGDHAPECNILGVALALAELHPDTQLVLIGDGNHLEKLLIDHSIPSARIEIIHAPEVITMGEHPTKALAQKTQSSISIGFKLLKQQEVHAFCSAGNTGAMQVGAIFSIKPIEGVIRPGIAGLLPQISGNFAVLMDVGANADCKPDVLYQFGEMATIYAREVLQIPSPRVALLSLGQEEQKGTLLTQAAYQIFNTFEKLNFVGNIEGSDLFTHKADVIICDGFVGNVVLKMAESFHTLLQTHTISHPFFEKFNYETVGGCPLLGVNGNVVIGHGSSTPTAVKNMILQAEKMAFNNLQDKIKDFYNI
jgi:phosphate acyltransferase